MTLMRWSPTGDLLGMQDEMNRLFASLAGRRALRAVGDGAWLPATDVQETDGAYTLKLDLPGVPLKDVKVTLIGDTLTVRGERRSEREQGDDGFHRVERVSGAFERSFTLGAPVDSGKVKATYRDGVLEIQVPKAEEARAHEISIEVAK